MLSTWSHHNTTISPILWQIFWYFLAYSSCPWTIHLDELCHIWSRTWFNLQVCLSFRLALNFSILKRNFYFLFHFTSNKKRLKYSNYLCFSNQKVSFLKSTIKLLVQFIVNFVLIFNYSVDSLTIYDGDSNAAEEIGKFCGNAIPTPSAALLRFVTTLIHPPATWTTLWTQPFTTTAM